MSGQWEVVGKKKDKSKQKTQKPAKDSKKQNAANGPKVEEILAKSQLLNLYSSAKSNKENHKPQEKAKKQENNAKKTNKKPEKQTKPTKVKPPKSIESALNSIDVEEFKLLCDKTKTSFPDAPVVLLKELAQFLNQKLAVEIQDPVFLNKSENYPLSVIPTAVKNIMERSIKDAGKGNAQIFYDISLTAMATDMSKNLHALGHKLFIQLLAHTDPKIVSADLSKHIELRNSYQNRQPIGLSILWGLGQGGIKDFNVGFRVFQEVMLPLIEMKNYSRYVILYLVDLINRFNDVPLSKEQYLLIMDIIFTSKKNISTDLTQSLHKVVPKLKALLFTNNNDKYHSFIEPLLVKLSSNNNSTYRNELCDVIVTCIQKDQMSFSTWNKHYTKNLMSSAILLTYIDQNWRQVSEKIKRKVLGDMLTVYSVTNDELMLKKRKDEGLLEAVEAIKKLTPKMAAKKSYRFPFKTLTFLLIVTIGGVVYYDIQQEGCWANSRTFKGLQDSGVYEWVNKASNRVKEGALSLHDYVNQKFPGYSDKVVETTSPYIQLSRDLSLVFYNAFGNVKEIVIAKYPVFIESVESYAPGLVEQSSKTFYSVWSASVLYYNRSVDYLKKEVFVGQLAPENVHRMVIYALNTTQQKASEYYYWLYEKVQTTIK